MKVQHWARERAASAQEGLPNSQTPAWMGKVLAQPLLPESHQEPPGAEEGHLGWEC